MAVGELGDRGDVDDVEQGVRRRLDPHHAGLGPQHLSEPGQVGGVDLEAGPAVDLGRQSVRPP